MKTRILLISDIGFQIDHFRKLFAQHNCHAFATLTVHCSPGGEEELATQNPPVTAYNVKDNVKEIRQSFDLIISYHCRQLFPEEIVTNIRCINIHPGFNPYNRGWYPGVFSIANRLPAGATIHEIDEKIDNGPIIAQKQIDILPEDTSGTVYPKIIQAEYDLLDEWFMPMLTGKYTTFLPTEKGNLNYKKDYYAFQELDLEETMTMKQAIDKLRALTHAPFKNGYYIDKQTGDKIYVSVEVKRVKNLPETQSDKKTLMNTVNSGTDKPKNILVFPCGSEIGLEIHRSLKYSRHFHPIGASSISDHGEFIYEDYVGDLPFANHPEFSAAIKKLVQDREISAIYPAMDSVAFELKKIENEIGCPVLTSPLKTTEICLSKLKTYNLLRTSIRVPKVFKEMSEIEQFPVFLKPEVGYGSRGVMKADDIKQVTDHLDSTDQPILITEYLSGPEYTVDCFTDFTGKLRFVGPRPRNRISNGISTRTSSIHVGDLSIMAEKINDNLELNGAWFFQVKQNDQNEFVLLEVAVRLAGSSATYRAKGINFAALNIYNAFKTPIQILENNYDVVLDRALSNKFKINYDFQHVYIDFDDALIIRGAVNADLIKVIFEFLNKGKEIHLITKHANNLFETLKAHRLHGLFNNIIHLRKDQRKSDYILHMNAIFIDDSYAERAEVKAKLGIPVFDIDMIESLI